MGIFSRLNEMLNLDMNDLIDKSEDPEKMKEQIISNMRSELINAEKSYAKSVESESMTEMKLDEAENVSAEWECKAKNALEYGDVESARQAAARKIRADEDIEYYREMFDTIFLQNKTLGNMIELLKTKINTVRNYNTECGHRDESKNDFTRSAESAVVSDELSDEQARIDAEVERLLAEIGNMN